MRIAMMGSGGFGGYFGARLSQGGADVVFIARGRHLQALRSDGLRIERGEGAIHLPRVVATDDPSTVGRADMVLISVKLWDLEPALDQIAPMVGTGTAVISFQNGVQKDEALVRRFGDAAVMGGVGYVATTIDRPGVIRQTGTMQRLVFGEYDGTRSARAEALLAACRAGGIEAEISTDISRSIWEKFVFLTALSGMTSATRLPLGPIRGNPRTRAMFLGVMGEVVAVGRALGVALPADYAEQRLGFVDGLPADMTASMHHDLQRGNRLELDWLSGGVVALGERAGVATPLNRAIRDLLTLHAEGSRS